MSSNEESVFIQKCLLIIEEHLGWGAAANWTNYDFEKLSASIFERTNVQLSITTLKRIWGRVRYENVPTVATLNTLAQFAGYEDWRSFRQAAQHQEPLAPEKARVKKPVSRMWRYGFPVVALAAVIAYFLISFVASNRKPDPADFKFKANKVMGEGVPNSVIFEYDAKAASTDSIFIIQTWDIRRKTRVPKNGTSHSAMYYYPGYFKAKLIVDGEIVKWHDLQITSNGWLGLVENEEKPFYFKKEEIIKQSGVEIDQALMAKNHFSLKPTLPKIRFFNQGDFGDLMNDNFVFETTVKNDYKEGDNACQSVEVLIQCKGDIIIIPLSAKNCVGDLHLVAAGKDLQSKTSDLSGFGADLSQWTTLKVESRNKSMQFSVNGKVAASLTFTDDAAGIVGVQYRFNGVGAIKDTRFRNKTRAWTL